MSGRSLQGVDEERVEQAEQRRARSEPPGALGARARGEGLGGLAHGVVTPPPVSLPEDALRPEDERGDQDPEDDRPRPVATRGAVEALVERLHAADHHRAQHGSGEVPDATEHRRGERDQPELEARVVAHVELEQVDEPATAASAPAMKNVTEIVRLTLIPIIAEASGSWATARIALPWRVERTNHVRTTRTGIDDQEDGQLVPREDHAADVEGLRARDEVRHRLEVDAVDGERDVLDDERHADGRDQRGQPGRVAQRLVRDALDARVDEREHRHRDREGGEEPEDDHDHARALVEPEHGHDQRARDEARRARTRRRGRS